jgi:two-component system, response regulator
MPEESQPVLIQSAADILLVEDEPADAELTTHALNAAGFADRVTHVTDGTEALEYLSGNCDASSLPKLILLDLNLRDMSGLHVLRQLKFDERTKRIPIVVLTGSRLGVELAESYKFGVNSYVIKPVDADEFNEVIAAIGNYWLRINETPLG